VEVECPAGNKWNSERQVCETVATALQAKADEHLDSTDVFKKHQRDDTPPDVITFPMLIGVGILYIFLSATR
jgi:hypothetical protein